MGTPRWSSRRLPSWGIPPPPAPAGDGSAPPRGANTHIHDPTRGPNHGGAWFDGCGVGEGRSMTVSIPWRIRWYREVQGSGTVGDIHGMSRTGQVEKVRCSARSVPSGPWARAGPCQGRTSGGGGGERVGEGCSRRAAARQGSVPSPTLIDRARVTARRPRGGRCSTRTWSCSQSKGGRGAVDTQPP
jgi:hypothetical protein